MRLVARGTIRRSGWFCTLLAGLLATVCAAREHVDGFDDERPTWKASSDDAASYRVVGHLRSREIRHQGESAELIDIEGRAALTLLRLEHELPPARVIDELSLSLWVQSSQNGVSLAARVVLPRQIDPATGRTMTVLLEGETYAKAGPWKQLNCDRLPARLTSLLPQLRLRLKAETGSRQDVDTSGAYVDAAVVSIRMGWGRSRFVLDDLRLGPIVDTAVAGEIRQVAGVESRPRTDPEFEFKIPSSFYVGGQPFFPRIVPYHDERPGDLSRMRMNVVWVPDFQDGPLLAELAKAGLRVMAVPPRPTAPDGSTLDPETVQLTPFGDDTAPILFWYLGTRIPTEAKRSLVQWTEQIRNADQTRRPVLGDVAGLERAYSSQLDMLGVSRAVLHTGFGLMTYRDWLIERRMQAKPGALLWTWIATEPSDSVSRQRKAAGWSPIVVEPEQLRLELYSALTAGYRGVGYWRHTAIGGEAPGADEAKLALMQLNMEVDLLEPFLATGKPGSQTPFKAQLPAARKLGQHDVAPGTNAKAESQRKASLNDRSNQRDLREQIARDLEAAIIHTDYGTLVLPVWYAANAQFVPGQMTANDAKIVVPGVGDAARAWEITTTDIREIQKRERVAGGTQVTLDKFDMTAAILITDDLMVVERLREKINAMRETSARVCLELARLKLHRTADVERRIRECGFAQPDAPQLLASAKAFLDSAESKWNAQHFNESRKDSADCMQLLRILQHACWSDAVGRIKSAVSSPHTLCFQTLPDHWDMVARHGRARHAGGRNLLRSGDFEDRDTMVAEGCLHEQAEIPGVRAAAELYSKSHKGKYCLRLIATAATGQDPPTVITERPVAYSTPPVTVYKGQIVHISGWVKVAAPSLNNLDGALLYDSLAGPSTALRWRTRTDWQQFELVREVTETSDLTLTMALSGLGEILFDDLQIIPLDADARRDPPAEKPPTGAKAAPTGALDFLKRIPRLGTKADAE